MKARNLLIEEAVALKDKVDKLENFIYLNGAIKNFMDFEYLCAAVAGGYIIKDPFYNYIDLNKLRESYIEFLPNAIHNLDEVKQEIKDFNKRVKQRAPHILKFGKFSQSIEAIIDIARVKNLLNDANAILNFYLVNQSNIAGQPKNGANSIVHYSKIKDRFVKDPMGSYRLLGYNEVAKKKKERKQKKVINQDHASPRVLKK